MDAQLHAALTRAAVAEEAVRRLEQQNERLEQQNERLQRQLDEHAQHQRQQIDQNAHFMRNMATAVLGRIVTTGRFNTERANEITEELNENHRVNSSRTMRPPLQPQFSYSKKREGDVIKGNFTRGQKRYVDQKRSKLDEDEFLLVQTVSVGSGINMGQHLAAQAELTLPLGVSSHHCLTDVVCPAHSSN
jgi:exonuclease VII large subunit